MFIYRELTWRELWADHRSNSSALIAQILIIVSAAGAFAWLVTTSGLPGQADRVRRQLQLQTWMLLLVINVILLFVGSVLEPPAAILLLTPLLTPIAYQAGVDPIHFGIIVTVNLAIGMFMPPFGLNLFASHALVRDAAARSLSRRAAVSGDLSGHADADHLCARRSRWRR